MELFTILSAFSLISKAYIGPGVQWIRENSYELSERAGTQLLPESGFICVF